MFRISRYRVVVFGVVLAWSLANRADAIRYELIDGAGGDQDGHTLAGFIEFEFPCEASCISQHITGFGFTVSGPHNYSYAYSSADGFSVLSLGPEFLRATATTLSIDYRRHGELAIGKLSDGPALRWLSVLEGRYISNGPGLSLAWNTSIASPPSATVIGRVVPEPSAAVLLLVSALGAMYLARMRANS